MFRNARALPRLLLAAVLLAPLLPDISEAQPQRPARLRGEILNVQADALTVRERSGETMTVRLDEPLTVLAVVQADIGRIGAGSYVGVAAMPQPDGMLRAVEVLIFPESMRGAGEGHYPWDLTPEATMTNAAVESVVSEVSGRTLRLKYRGGEKSIAVPPDAPIVTFEPGDRAMLRPGSHVFVNAVKQPDGSFAAGRVAVGKDGLVPPM